MTLIIPNIIFVVLIAISTGYLTFLTTKGGLTDNRFIKPWEKLTQRGKIVFFILFMIFVLLVSQEWNNQNREKRNNSVLKKERDDRDSVITEGIKAGVDSNRKKLFEDISKAFLQQELRIDTVNKTIKIIRDSLKKTTINNYSEGDPVIIIGNNGIFPKDKSVMNGAYKITFKSVDEGSTNYNIVCYLLTEDKDGNDLSKINFFPKNLKLAKNAEWTTGFGSFSSPPAKTIYVYLKGSYTTLDGAKLYKLDDLYLYNSAENKVSILLNSERDKIIKLINSVPESKLILR
jgi:hypothetical protein